MILTFKSIKSKASSVEIETIYSVAVLNMWYIHVHICVHVCVEGHICVYTPEASVDYLAQSHFTFFLFFETGSVTDPGTHWVREIGWLLSFKDRPVSTFQL